MGNGVISHSHVWLLRGALAIPAALALARYWSDSISYGEFIHISGDWAVWLLILTLSLTPLTRLFPRLRVVRMLMRQRRDIGLAVFAYASLHTLAYLERKSDFGLILSEGLDPGLWTGWLALVFFSALAVTSNNAAMRALRRGWKKIHLFVYPAAALTMAHWLFTAFDPGMGILHAGILLAIVTLRVVLSLRPVRERMQAARAAQSSIT
jgi:sulfoxide reductase heme-binding subunit YedZ